jgi:hypothetical protein
MQKRNQARAAIINAVGLGGPTYVTSLDTASPRLVRKLRSTHSSGSRALRKPSNQRALLSNEMGSFEGDTRTCHAAGKIGR